MEFRIADSFTDSLARLTGDEQKAVKTTVFDLRVDPSNSGMHLHELRSPPGNELEKLSRDRAGQHSIRINRQYRICFRWSTAGADDVEVTDYR